MIRNIGFPVIEPKKKPVKNKMLWVELDNQIARHSINWQWIKGHLGHIHNEQADYLARRFIEKN